MKLIKTIVRANRVDDVRDALSRLRVDMTVTGVRPEGPRQRRDARFPEGGHAVPAANALIELVVRDDIVAEVIQRITRAARMDEIGDGHVSVLPLDRDDDGRPRERDIV